LWVQVLPGLPDWHRRLYWRRFTRQDEQEESYVADTKKQNAFTRYFRESTGELRKVAWPTWPEARQLTIIVIVVMVIMGVYLAIVDGLGGLLIDLAIKA
jgi:preprotein translocase subunit SecE